MDKPKRSIYAASPETLEKSGYLGKAGEHLVLAKLLRRQFNAALVAVDSGIDILAEKEGRITRIQVKTRTLRGTRHNRALLPLSKSSLERKAVPDFYVIVLIPPTEQEKYLVIPKSKIHSMIDAGQLPLFSRVSRYQSFLINQGNKWFVKSSRDPRNEITEYLDHWDLIK